MDRVFKMFSKLWRRKQKENTVMYKSLTCSQW